MPLYPTKPRTLVGANVADYGFRYADTVQRHPLGHFIDTEDGSRFRYVYVGTGGLQSEFGCFFAYKTVANAVVPTQTAGSVTKGSYKLTVTIDTAAGPASGAFAENSPYLIGGYAVIGNGTLQHPQMRRIVGNIGATTGSGGTTTLVFDEPLDTTVVVNTTNVEVMLNRYSYVTSAFITAASYGTFIGMPAVTCDAGSYAWVQTRGPCWITSDGNTCDSALDRRVYFFDDGSCRSGNDVTGDVNVMQFAGNAMDASSSGASNAPFVWLEME